jgi:potassium channel subfamily K
MGNREEAEWVLERLTTTLDRELEVMRREELERDGGGRTQTMTKDKPGEGQRPSTGTSETNKIEKESSKV